MDQKLYRNADFVPMTEEGASFEAMVVEDGVIAFTGTLEDARAFAPSAREVDLEGRAVMPGFIDGHGHFMMAGQMVTQADLSQCQSFEDIKEVLRAFIADNGITPDRAVLGCGYDQNELLERRHPDRFVLDEVSTDIPILISQVSGHMGVVNSKGLALVGVTAETPDPEGARYGRVGDSREPDGYLEEVNAIMPAMEAFAARNPSDKAEVVRKVHDIYASNGITTCQDGASVKMFVDDFVSVIENEDIVKIDVVGYPMVAMDWEDVHAAYPQYFGEEYRNHFRFGGLKIVLDGSPQGRTAWMSEPYSPGSEGEGWRAYPAYEDDEVKRHAKTAVDGGYQLLAHCNGGAASDQLLRCYREAYEASGNPGKDDLRPVMIHCQTARRDQYESMAELGMIPSIFTAHIWYWGDVHLKNFGLERGSRVSAVHDALECGLVYNFHTDTPIVPPNMLHTVWCAVNRVTKRGVQLAEDQKVGVYDALKGITVNPAYAYHEEGRKGSSKWASWPISPSSTGTR